MVLGIKFTLSEVSQFQQVSILLVMDDGLGAS